MSDYNLLGLSSEEFEDLCSDILSFELGIKFKTFTSGKDKGIDIRKEDGDETIIGQAKRYKNVPSNLDKELEKIKKIKKCKKYYLFLACSLSPTKESEIYTLFKDYMDNNTFIYDGKRINSLLSEERYKNIVLKYPKLWYTSNMVFEVLNNRCVTNDSEILKNKILTNRKLYVETSDFKRARSILTKSRLLLIKGNPGVGKTTISEMLILYFLNEHPNANVIYSSDSKIDNIKQSLSKDKDVYEIIFINDFLGDIYLNLRQDKVNSINYLIEYLKIYKNKYLVINTRITILNEASNNFIDFQKSIDNISIKEVEISNISYYDRAQILYNHLLAADFSDDVINQILDNKIYIKIIKHQNFNPRLIERICNVKYFNQKNEKNFEKYALDILQDQQDTWMHCFKNDLTQGDRVLLHILGTFETLSESVNIDVLKEAYLHEIKKYSFIDLSIDVFKTSMQRLIDNLIRIQVRIINGNYKKYVSFLNPSIKECVLSVNFYNKNNFLYFDQYCDAHNKFLDSDDLKKIILEEKINEFKFYNISRCEVLLYFFGKNQQYIDIKYIKYISECLFLNYYDLSHYFQLRELDKFFSSIVNSSKILQFDFSNIFKDELMQYINNLVRNLDKVNVLKALSMFDKNAVEECLNTYSIKYEIACFYCDKYDIYSSIEELIRVYNEYEEGQFSKQDSFIIKDQIIDDVTDYSMNDLAMTDLYNTYKLKMSRYDFEDIINDDLINSFFDKEQNNEREYYDDDNFEDESEDYIDSLFEGLKII